MTEGRPVIPRVAPEKHEVDYELMLLWTCQECGWQVVTIAPGFAGDGWFHFSDGVTPCGPITAQRTHG